MSGTILIISPFLPWPLDSGGKIRVFNLLKERSRHHKVTLACLTDGSVPDFGPLADICAEVVTVVRPTSSAKDLFRFLVGQQPFNFLRYHSSCFTVALRQLSKRQKFDQVQIEFSMMWQYADIFADTPTLLNAHNVEADIVRQLGAACRNPLKRFLYRVETSRLLREERRAWRDCTSCCAVSEREREEIARQCGDHDKVKVVANGVDLERFEFRPKQDSNYSVLLLGGMEYAPNLDAVTWFIQEILPLLKQTAPEMVVHIVGRGLERIPLANGEKAVHLHENAPDIRPWLYSADLLAVPLRMGAGTRIKILEAMAAGVPIVTTGKGCEGIAVRDGEHLLIADTPADFAEAVTRLLGDRDAALSMAVEAHRLVEGHFSWQRLAQRMEQE